jgi:hypothetical protein
VKQGLKLVLNFLILRLRHRYPSGAPADTKSRPKRDRCETTSEQAAQILLVMVLNPYPIYPSAGHYVLRLHRDAQPQNGVLLGHIVHVTSGDSFTFTSGQELLVWLASRTVDQPDFKESK